MKEKEPEILPDKTVRCGATRIVRLARPCRGCWPWDVRGGHNVGDFHNNEYEEGGRLCIADFHNNEYEGGRLCI